MRVGTFVFLLALVLAIALFGWKVLGYALVALLLLPLVLFGALAVGIWVLKRRMQRKLRELHAAMQQAQEQAVAEARARQARKDAIDVTPTDIRDR